MKTQTEYKQLRYRAYGMLAALWVLLLLSFFLALNTGSAAIQISDIFNLLNQPETDLERRILLELRLPRAIHAFTTGALLAIAGALMQVLLRNPLADPYVLGVSGGAAVFALIAIALGLAGMTVSLFAFIGSMLAMLLVFGLARGQGNWTPTRLLLTGVVLASGWGAIVSFILSIAPQGKLRSLVFWLMGDLSFAENMAPGLIALGIGIIISLYFARNLNILALDPQQAASFGIHVPRLRWQIYIIASLLTAMAVVQVGNVGFVGLVIPHLLRLLGLRDYRLLIPGAVLAGGSLLLLADTISRSAITDVVLPVGVLTAAIGVPLFILLLYRGTRKI